MPDQAQRDQAWQDPADLAVSHMGPKTLQQLPCSENGPNNATNKQIVQNMSPESKNKNRRLQNMYPTTQTQTKGSDDGPANRKQTQR